ncbi:HPP family protein [Nanoarchaeota archaeon]
MKKGDITVKDAMVKPVLVYPDDSIQVLVRKLKSKDTNVVLVINKKREFLGEITEEQLLKLFVPSEMISERKVVGFLGAGYDKSFFAEKAKDLMTKHRYTVTTDSPIKDVVWLVYTPGFRFIPVLNKKKQVVGVVTPSSILNAYEYKK